MSTVDAYTIYTSAYNLLTRRLILTILIRLTGFPHGLSAEKNRRVKLTLDCDVPGECITDGVSDDLVASPLAFICCNSQPSVAMASTPDAAGPEANATSNAVG